MATFVRIGDVYGLCGFVSRLFNVAECGQVRVVFGGHGIHVVSLGDGMAGPCAMGVHEIGNKASVSALLSGFCGERSSIVT
jgi:hypothetical protein